MRTLRGRERERQRERAREREKHVTEREREREKKKTQLFHLGTCPPTLLFLGHFSDISAESRRYSEVESEVERVRQ